MERETFIKEVKTVRSNAHFSKKLRHKRKMSQLFIAVPWKNENTHRKTVEHAADKDAMEVVLKANQACEEGMFTHAIHLYTEGLRRDPQNAMVFSNRSAAFLLSDDPHAALSDAERAIRLQPTWSKGYLRKGLALQKLQEFDGSVICLAQGLAYETQSRQILSSIVETVLLSSLRVSFDVTQKQLRKLGLDQNPFVMLSAVGQELLSVGKTRAALSVLKSAEQVNTDNLRLKGSLMSALASANWKLGNHKDAIGYMEEDLEICRSLGDQHGECRVMGNLGNAHYSIQQYEASIQYHKDQLLLATDIKSRKTAALALGSLGHTYSALGEQDQALACHEQCVDLSLEMGNKVSEAEEYGNIGCIYLSKGDTVKAMQYHEQHLSIAQELNNIPLQTKAFFNMASLHLHVQDYSRALKCYQELLTFGVKMKSRTVEMRAYAGLGSCAREIGELATSLNYYEQYLSIALKIPDAAAVSKAYCCIGNVNQGLGRLPEALEAHKKHLVKVLELRDRVAEGRVYGNLGNVHCAMGHFNKAVKLHEQALAIAVEEGDTVSQGSTNGNLGIAYQGLGELEQALKHLDSHLTISRECLDVEGQLKALSNLGNFHANKSDYQTALDLFQEQLEISQARGDVEAQCKALNSVALLYKMQGSFHLATSFAQKAVSLSGNRPRLLSKNLVMLSKLFILRGQHNDARVALQRAYDTQTDTQTDAQHCTLVCALAGATLDCGYWRTAQLLYAQLSDLSQDCQLPQFEMRSLAGYGKIELQKENYPHAKEHLESSLAVCREKRLIREEFQQQLQMSSVLCALCQYEDAHSALVSAGELLPSKPHSSQDDRNMLAQLSRGFGLLSLAKGDYTDALQHFTEQRELLVGEMQVWETQNLVLCLWLLGSGYEALRILESLEESVPEENPYLKLALSNTRAKLSTSAGNFREAIHQHETRLDLIRRQGDRVMEMQVLTDLAASYLLEGLSDQALVNYDQSLMVARDIEHVTGQCLALLGQAKSYFQMGELQTCLELCEEVEHLDTNSPSIASQCYLLSARASLERGELSETVQYSRSCVEQATYSPLLLAAATALLGQALVQQEKAGPGYEALLSSCSQFEIILLQRSIEFVYEEISPLQELSYSYLFDLQSEPLEKLWIQERVFRWERARYFPPSSPFPAPHFSSQSLNDLSRMLGQDNVCVVVRVDSCVVHTWLLTIEGLHDYNSTKIDDKEEILESVQAAEVLFKDLISDIEKLLHLPHSILYVVLSEDSITKPILDQLKTQLFPRNPISICGCVDDIGRHSRLTGPEKSLSRGIVSTHTYLRQVSHQIDSQDVNCVAEELGRYHIVHISANQISFSDTTPDTVFVGDITAECVFLYNTEGLIYEDITRLSLCLLSNVRCVITFLELSENTLQLVKCVDNHLQEGCSVIEAVTKETKLLADPRVVECHGFDWLPRKCDCISGFRLLLISTAPGEICPAIRATLEIIDKIKTGFNRQVTMTTPLSVQYEILGSILGWDEILTYVGTNVIRDKVSIPDNFAGTERCEEVRNILTSLLDCGEQLCQQFVELMKTKQSNVVSYFVDILELHLSTIQPSSPPPRLPLPSEMFTAVPDLIQALGLKSTGQATSSSILLTVSPDTSTLRIEAALFLLRTLFHHGTAVQPYLIKTDDVGAIEI